MILCFIQLGYNDSITILMDLVLNSLTSSTTRLHFRHTDCLIDLISQKEFFSLCLKKKSISTMSWLFAELLSRARDYTQRVINAETAVR